jgi:predicted small integral membrane protein
MSVDFNLAWMAWTWQTATFFAVIGLLLAAMSVWEYARPGGAPRHGVLGLDTTRGDRLFISLLVAAYIHLGWLAVTAAPLWGATLVSIAVAGLVFRYV